MPSRFCASYSTWKCSPLSMPHTLKNATSLSGMIACMCACMPGWQPMASAQSARNKNGCLLCILP